MYSKKKNSITRTFLPVGLGLGLALTAGLHIKDLSLAPRSEPGSGMPRSTGGDALAAATDLNNSFASAAESVNPSEQFRKNNEVVYGELGFSVANIDLALQEMFGMTDKNSGVVITGIAPNSVASTGGLEEGDVVLRLNRIDVGSVEEFDEVMDTLEPGDNALFYVAREETKFFAACEVPEA